MNLDNLRNVPVSELQAMADLSFLALTAWREARGESDEAIVAVCNAVLNRVKRTRWWGTDVMSVLFKKWQFSSLTDPNDRQLTTWPRANDDSWKRCLLAAYGTMTNSLLNPVPGADSYFDDSIDPPYWADEERFVKQIGRLRFYDLDQDYERERTG